MTTKGAKEVLQHPIVDVITKVAIGMLLYMLTTVSGDVAEMKKEGAVRGQQLGSLIKTVEKRSDQLGRIVAIEIGKASREDLQALKDTMAQMNTELRTLIETRIREVDDRE